MCFHVKLSIIIFIIMIFLYDIEFNAMTMRQNHDI